MSALTHTLTISQLTEEMSHGPFKVHGHAGKGWGANWVEIVSTGGEFSPAFAGIMQKADAEMTCRLLNFVIAGGIDTLEDILNETVDASTYPTGPNLDRSTRSNIRALLAILRSKPEATK